MEFTAEDAKSLIHAAWDILSSMPAQRTYALVLAAWVVRASLRSALRADREARHRIDAGQEDFKGIVSGRPAFRDQTIEQQREKILAASQESRRKAWSSLRRSVFAGVVVPSSLLMLVVMFYSWLDPTGGQLLDGGGRPLTHPAPLDAALFVLDQTLRGAVSDALEVFDQQITPLQNNPHKLLFSAGIFAHHLFLEAFIFSGLALFAHSLWRIRRFERETLDWFNERTAEAKRAAAARQSEAAASSPQPTSATH